MSRDKSTWGDWSSSRSAHREWKHSMRYGRVAHVSVRLALARATSTRRARKHACHTYPAAVFSHSCTACSILSPPTDLGAIVVLSPAQMEGAEEDLPDELPMSSESPDVASLDPCGGTAGEGETPDELPFFSGTRANHRQASANQTPSCQTSSPWTWRCPWPPLLRPAKPCPKRAPRRSSGGWAWGVAHGTHCFSSRWRKHERWFVGWSRKENTTAGELDTRPTSSQCRPRGMANT